jgi:hypothetical protein
MPSLSKQSPLSFDFGQQGCSACTWVVVVDDVMGGQSSAEITITENSLVLSGNISLENNGGFASIRTPYDGYDLSSYSAVEIRYRSRVQNFALVLANYRRYYEPKFKTPLPVTEGDWRTTQLSFDQFKKMRFDEELGGGPNTEELSQVLRLGLISDDKRAGKFEFEIDYLRFIP